MQTLQPTNEFITKQQAKRAAGDFGQLPSQKGTAAG